VLGSGSRIWTRHQQRANAGEEQDGKSLHVRRAWSEAQPNANA
jgi:hypothetical protein